MNVFRSVVRCASVALALATWSGSSPTAVAQQDPQTINLDAPRDYLTFKYEGKLVGSLALRVTENDKQPQLAIAGRDGKAAATIGGDRAPYDVQFTPEPMDSPRVSFQSGYIPSRSHSTVDKVYNVLFLCTGNSARSIMAECAINRWGQGRFRGFSAGSFPKGKVHPMTLRLLERLNYRTAGLRSKSWDEFAEGKGPPLDFVFTVCDQAAGETCPAWPGQPMTAHWGVEDPAAFVGTDEQTYRFFRTIYGQLDNRIKIFTSLPIRSLDKLSLQKTIEEIGRSHETATAS